MSYDPAGTRTLSAAVMSTFDASVEKLSLALWSGNCARLDGSDSATRGLCNPDGLCPVFRRRVKLDTGIHRNMARISTTCDDKH